VYYVAIKHDYIDRFYYNIIIIYISVHEWLRKTYYYIRCRHVIERPKSLVGLELKIVLVGLCDIRLLLDIIILFKRW